MATLVGNPGMENSGLLVLGSDLVVDESTFVVKCHSSASDESTCKSGKYSTEDFSDLEELQFLKIEGVDRQRRRIVRIVGKFLPATVIDNGRLKEYITRKLVSEIQDEHFSVVYFHSAVERRENSPGMLNLRRIYEDLPQALRQQLEAIFVVHPGLKSRLLLATIGRFFLSEGFYSKLNYVSRVEFLWDYLRKGQVEVPDFVQDHDKDLENRPLMDYGFETDPYAYVDGPGLNSSMRARSF